ncbi:MAG: hypothetical protein IT363_09585 [Methanoregulaceae archaeon]|nr:hypothetical protein [Methanoregulaceae archaeon]
MTRTMLFALAATTTVAGGLSMFFGQGTPVNLQPTTPGTQQVGNANVSGRVIAGSIQAENSSPTAQVIVGNATSTTGANFGGFFRSDSVLGRALYGRASAKSGTTSGVYGQSDSPAGRGVTGVVAATSGNATGVWGQTASAGGRGVYGYNTSATGVNYGVYGRSMSPAGFGVYAEGTLGASGNGVIGGNLGVGVSNPQARLHSNGTSWFTGDTTPLPPAAGGGVAVGFSGSQGYLFAFDYASFTPKNLLLQGPGGNVGVGTLSPSSGRLHVDGGNTTAVYATSTSGIGSYSVSGTNAAVYGYSSSDYGVDGRSNNSIGVYGQSYSSGGVLAQGPYIGVQGNSTGSDANRQAVRGDNAGSATGYAGLFYGNTWVVGTLTKSAGAFLIDHPLDPENKYLTHSFVESPDMKNIYDGTVVTDAQGVAMVEMPEWFDALNKDFRYQLTVIGQFAQAIVAKEIENNIFVIRTDKPNVKVSWQVTGIRKDPYAEKNRLEVETYKPKEFRGKFIYPAGYGEPNSKGIPANMVNLNGSIAAKKRPRPTGGSALPPTPR